MDKIKGAEERGFKGIWIPAEIWLREDINSVEKILLAEIDSLDQGEGCFASNNYLANFIHVSIRRLQEFIQNLKNKNLLEQTGSNGEKRQLKINKNTIYSAHEKRETLNSLETKNARSRAKKREISHPYNKEDNKVTKCIKNTLDIPSKILPSSTRKLKKKKAAPKFKPDSLGGKLSQFLLDEIEKHNPTFPTPNLATWQGTFNKMIFIQGYQYSEIKEVSKYSQQSKFWRPFVLNPFVLAAKYETLKIQWMQAKEQNEEEDIFEQAKEENI